jgi:hypothetical protein
MPKFVPASQEELRARGVGVEPAAPVVPPAAKKAPAAKKTAAKKTAAKG